MAKKKKALDSTHIYYEKSRNKFVAAVPMPDGSRPKRRFDTIDEATAYRDEMLAIVENRRIAINLSITVKEWLALWLEKYCGDLAEKTRQSYAYMIRTHCQGLYNLRMVDEVKAFHITNVFENMKNKGYAYDSIKRMRAVLSSAFNRVHNEQLIVYDVLPTAGCKLPKRRTVGQKVIQPTAPRTAYPETVLDALVNAARTIGPNKNIQAKWACLILLLRFTGMRLSECLGICKEDVYFSEGKAVITLHQGVHDVDKNQSDSGKCWAVEDLKSQASYRTLVVYDPELVSLLKVMHSLDHPTVTFKGATYDFLFATRTGSPILHSSFYRMFAKIREKINSTIRTHEIRHSVATILGADSSIPFADSAKFLGHTKEVFIKYYVHEQKESVSVIGRKLAAKKPELIKETTALYKIKPFVAPKLAPKMALQEVS